MVNVYLNTELNVNKSEAIRSIEDNKQVLTKTSRLNMVIMHKKR